MTIKISQQFDAGAIEVLRADDAQSIELNIRKDSHADITQWFYFRLQGAQGEACTIRFMNAGKSAYPDGWKDYQPSPAMTAKPGSACQPASTAR